MIAYEIQLRFVVTQQTLYWVRWYDVTVATLPHNLGYKYICGSSDQIELVTPSVFWNQESELNNPWMNSQRCELSIHGSLSSNSWSLQVLASLHMNAKWFNAHELGWIMKYSIQMTPVLNRNEIIVQKASVGGGCYEMALRVRVMP